MIGRSARGVECCKEERRGCQATEFDGELRGLRIGFGREIVTSQTRYSCKLLRVQLKLFFLNTSYLFLASAHAIR